MKSHERSCCEPALLHGVPAIGRVDGRHFSSFTKGMAKPYSDHMIECMTRTALFLAEHTNAVCAYTQSDEISLIWHNDCQPQSEIWFNGRTFKMVSNLASLATLAFYRNVLALMPEYAERLPTFDARVYNVPTKQEAVNYLIWREWDATKNSITSATSCFYSHTEMFGKNSKDRQELLFAKGVNWNDYPSYFKRGTYIRRKIVEKPFSAAELDKLPPLHTARSNPEFKVKRTEYVVENDFPRLASVANGECVIFQGQEPIIKN